MKEYIEYLEGLDCANCAASMERQINDIDGIENARIAFMTGKLSYSCKEEKHEELLDQIRQLVSYEDVLVLDHKHDQHMMNHHEHEMDEHDHHHHHHHEHEHECSCCSHEDYDHDHHHHHHEHSCSCSTSNVVKEEIHAGKDEEEHVLYIKGLDCANCAANIERKIMGIDGVVNARINFVNGKCVYITKKDEQDLEDLVCNTIRKEESDVVITKSKQLEVEKVDYKIVYLIVGTMFFVGGLFLKGYMRSTCMLIAYVILGFDVLLKAVRNIGKGKIFDENFLMAVATLAALYLKDYSEAAGVMLFYQIGEYFQDKAVESSRKSIGALMDIRPDVANVLRHGEWVSVLPEEVDVEEVIQVKPGERIPLDGIVIKGSSSLNTSSLTGESKPLDVDVNSHVVSGSLNESGLLEIKVLKKYNDSTVAKILDLVENSDSRRAKSEQFITKFARWYTPTVVVAAVVVALVVGLFGSGFDDGIYRACTFLVISCPCALVISIPLGFFAGIGGLSKEGILVKGASLVESLKDVETVVFDKTGTLTSGVFHIDDVYVVEGMDRQALIDLASVAEHYSTHPIGLGIKKESKLVVSDEEVTSMKEIPGKGLSCVYKNDSILVGNSALMQEHGISVEKSGVKTIVHVAKNDMYCGYIELEDTLKDDAIEAIESLHALNKQVVLVSGDNKQLVKEAALKLGVDSYYGECLPQDKVEIVKDLCSKQKTAFVGDGVNDAPVIANSDLGFAMGALGSDAAIEAADVVLMNDRVSDVSKSMKASNRVVRVVNQNIYGALIVKFAILVLGAFGFANMWLAIFADTGVALICVMNSMRLLKVK